MCHVFLTLLFFSLVGCKAISFVAVADVHLQDDFRPGTDPSTYCTRGEGKVGTFGFPNCDCPSPTLSSAASFMATLQADFVVWLGDSPSKYGEHPGGKDEIEHTFANAQTILNALRGAFPNLTVFPTLGNHDAVPDYGSAPPTVDPGYFKRIAQMWSWLPSEALETVRRGGFYQVRISKGLRVVSLNTLFWYMGNPWAENATKDIAGQLDWFESVVAESKRLDERILIIGHVPPAFSTALFQWIPRRYDRFTEILTKFPGVVTMQLYGHTHTDVFSLISGGTDSSKKEKILGIAQVVPGLNQRASGSKPGSGPSPGHNPAFRRYVIDDGTKEPREIETYFANITEANEQGGLTWRMSYSLPSEYGMANLSDNEFLRLAQRIFNDEATWCLFDRHFWVESGRISAATKHLWRRLTVCTILVDDIAELGHCLGSPIPEFNC